MSRLTPSQHRLYSVGILLGIFAAGIFLRIWSFTQNTRLYGDVNLFALTARQLAWSGRLEYPLKYDFTPQSPYLTLASPASQHPPFWPLLGAILARLWESQDTFLMLKSLSLVVGMCLWLAFLPKRTQVLTPSKFLPFALMAVSPWIVDFSTNASPYILIALILVLAEWMWRTDQLWNKFSLVGLGGFCALALLTHNNLILLPFSFLIRILSHQDISRREKWLKVGIFLSALMLFLSPWLAWNRYTFGQWFHSPSTYYLLEQLGMAKITQTEDRIVWAVKDVPLEAILTRYSLLFAKSAWAGIRQFIGMLTPLGFIGVLVALVARYGQFKGLSLAKTAQVGIKTYPSPTFLYLLTIAFWATYKTRFLIPLLPCSFLLMGESLSYGQQLLRRTVALLWLGVAVLFLWTMLPYRQNPLNFYYGHETPAIAHQYDQMKSLALQLEQKPTGVILGVADGLDGGIETIYWTKQPFVMGRGLDQALWQKLAADFKVRTLWCECRQVEMLQNLFPTIQLLLVNDLFCVVRFP